MSQGLEGFSVLAPVDAVGTNLPPDSSSTGVFCFSHISNEGETNMKKESFARLQAAGIYCLNELKRKNLPENQRAYYVARLAEVERVLGPASGAI